MKINTDLALIPVFREIQPLEGISRKNAAASYLQEERLVRLSYAGQKSRRIGDIYDRMGDVKVKSGLLGENVDIYV